MPRPERSRHIGPPNSRESAPLDEDEIAELRATIVSQTELARRIGISQTTISRALTGEKVSKAAQDALRAETRRQQ